MIICFTGRCRRYSPINSRDPMCPLPFSSPTIGKFLWTLFIHPVPVALVVTRYLETFFDASRILCSLLPWRFFFLACPMDNSKCLVFFVYVPCHGSFDPTNSMCAIARNRHLIPVNSPFQLRCHSGRELVLGKSNRE